MSSISFSEWLLKTLKERGLSQSDLARAAGVSRAAISDIISSRRNIGTDVAKSIAKALKLPVEQVYRAAGLLPIASEREQLIEIILHELDTLTPEDRDDVIEFIEFKARRKRKSNHKKT